MKISEFIKYLENQKAEHGDIEVQCVTPGVGNNWERTKDVINSIAVHDYGKILSIGEDG